MDKQPQLPECFPLTPLRLCVVFCNISYKIAMYYLPFNHSSPEKNKQNIKTGGGSVHSDRPYSFPSSWLQVHKYLHSFHWGIKASKEVLICSDVSLALGLAIPTLGKGLYMKPYPHYTIEVAFYKLHVTVVSTETDEVNSPEPGVVYSKVCNISFRIAFFYMQLSDCQRGNVTAHLQQEYLSIWVYLRWKSKLYSI